MQHIHFFASLAWRAIPSPLRRTQLLQSAKTRVQTFLADHNDTYDSNYYTLRRKTASQSATLIAQSIAKHLSPSFVLDAGCATGDLLASLRSHGIRGIGFEYSDAALSICRDEHLDVRKHNLETTLLPRLPEVDTVVCMEVAEHLPSWRADKLVSSLTRNGQTLLFTAAPPGQGGTDHVNEQPPEYWIEKFNKANWQLDPDTTNNLKNEWQKTPITPHYWKNLMVFRRSTPS